MVRLRTHVSFAAWHTEAARAGSFRRRANRAVSRIRHSVTSRALDRWTEWTAEAVRMRGLLARAINRFAAGTASRAFQKWRGDADRRTRRFNAAEGVVRRVALGAGPAGHCPTRHPPQCEPSFLVGSTAS
jgi:hypothetical protein